MDTTASANVPAATTTLSAGTPAATAQSQVATASGTTTRAATTKAATTTTPAHTANAKPTGPGTSASQTGPGTLAFKCFPQGEGLTRVSMTWTNPGFAATVTVNGVSYSAGPSWSTGLGFSAKETTPGHGTCSGRVGGESRSGSY